MMEFDNMQQLDDAMTSVIRNEENIEEAHVGFNQLVDGETIQHFLYRDYPDQFQQKTKKQQENLQPARTCCYHQMTQKWEIEKRKTKQTSWTKI